MLTRPTRQRFRVAGSATVSVLLALAAFAGMASAHTSKPASIAATINGVQVSVSGSWSWQSQATASLQYKVGYAIDWGDVASGNAVSTFHIGDGTAGTNHVLTNVSPNTGASGAWGPAVHTYAASGTYTVCVIMYDVGPVLAASQPPTGQFSLVAGGTGHNTDNSVEELLTPGTQCTQVTVAAATATATATASSSASASATPTPGQSVAGVTSVPTVASTLPPTSSSTDPTSGGNSPGLSLILLALSMVFGVIALKPMAKVRSKG
jgi:hypothetical protein